MSVTVKVARAARAGDAATVVAVPSDRIGKRAPGLESAPWSFLAGRGFAGKVGEVVAAAGERGRTVLYVGVGPAASADAGVLRRAAGAAARAALRHRTLSVDLARSAAPSVDRLDALAAVAEGVVLGAYRYTALRSDPPPAVLAEVGVVDPSGAAGRDARAAVEAAVRGAEATCLARDLVNEPGGTLTPPAFAERAAEIAAASGLSCTVHDDEAVRRLGLGGLLAVNRGSAQPARFVELGYDPESGGGPGTVALVGKGITYDSGGLSIKTHDGLLTMKCDMSGAAAVLAAMSACRDLGVTASVRGYLPLTDNMLGPDATRVGDVVRHCDGSTTEVLNTDAEGRLVLGDAIAYATTARKGHRPPDAILDVATLTGACAVALGARTAGLMGSDDGWTAQLRAAADAAGEPVWPLPLPESEKRNLESKVADRKNTGHKWGGALFAGVFLRTFVHGDVPWAHLDIAGPAFNEGAEDCELPAGGTGFGVRTILRALASFESPGG